MVAHHLAEMDKGAGIAMCCTFGDLTDVLWWRELDLPVRTVIGRDGRLARETPRLARQRAGLGGVRAAGRQDRLLRPRGDGRDAARDRRPRRRAEADHPDGQLLRAGRQAARDRRHPPVVHPQRRPRRGRPRRDARARRRDHLAADAHEGPLRQLGLGADRRLADLAAALLRHPVPGLVPPRRATASPTTPTRSCPPRPSCRSTRRPTPRAATARTSAGSPTASSATPT